MCVTRPGPWGNPYETAYEFRRILALVMERQFSADELRQPVLAQMKWIAEHITDLRGKDLACWCSLDQTCHADVLLELANR